jgi:hypothetical protein
VLFRGCQNYPGKKTENKTELQNSVTLTSQRVFEYRLIFCFSSVGFLSGSKNAPDQKSDNSNSEGR